MNEEVAGRATFVVSADDELSVVLRGMEVKAAEFERAVVGSMGRAGEATGKPGETAKKGADEVDAATKREILAFERRNAALALSESGYRRFVNAQKGLNGEAIEPFIQANERLKRTVESRVAAEQKAASDQSFINGLASRTNAIGKTVAELQLQEAALLKVQAAERGLTVQASAYIAKLEEQARATQKIGISAGQTRQAIAQLPAQFTDVFTSLAGGQNPLLVFIQQGGQIKDSFGGIGNAVRELGAVFTPLRLAIGGAVGALAGLGFAYLKGASEAEQFQKTLILTGNAAGVTAGQLSDMAAAVDKAGAGTTGRAAEVLNQIAASGRVGAGSLARFTAAALEMERVGGPAADETAKAFAELGKSPFDAAVKLNEATGAFTAGVLGQIKALEEQGRTVDAARVAQEAYAQSLEDRAPALLKNLGLIESAWLGIKTATKEAVDFVLGIGRADTLGAQLEGMQKLLAMNESLGRGEAKIPGLGSQNDGLREQIRLLSRAILLRNESAAAEAASVQLSRDTTEALKLKEKYYDAEKKKKDEIRQVDRLRLADALSELEAKNLIAKIEEKYAPKTGKGNGNRERNEEIDLLNKLVGISSTYNEELETLDRLLKRGDISLEQYGEALRDLVALQPFAVRAARDEEEARKLANKAIEEAAKAQERNIQSVEKSIEAAARETQALQDQIVELTLGKQAIADRIALRLDDQAAAADSAALWTAVTEAEAEAYRNLAAQLRAAATARRALTAGQENKDLTDASNKAAKEAAKEWERAAQQIESALTDSLLRGFESGKGIAENFADTVKNIFKTLVLKPGIEAVVKGGLGDLLPGSKPSTPGASGSAFGGNTKLAEATSYLVALDAAANKQFGAAIGTAAGAAFFGPQGAAIGNLIGSAIDKAARGSAGSQGAGSVVSDTSGRLLTLRDDESTFARNLNSSVDSALRAIVEASTGAIEAVTGRATDATAKFATDGKRDAFGQFILSQSGTVTGFVGDAAPTTPTSGGDDRRFSADPQRGLEEFAAEVAKVTRAALEAADLPKFARDQLAKLGEGATLDELKAFSDTLKTTVDAIATVQDAFEPLGGSFAKLAGLSADSVLGIAEAVGGFDRLQSAANTYYEQFFSDAERTANATISLSAALADVGLAVPSSRDAYRSLVEGLDLTTEAGAKQYATLLNLSGAFAELNPLTQQAVAIRRSEADIAKEGYNLETQRLQLLGDTTSLRDRERATLDQSNRDLYNRVNALKDEQAAAAEAKIKADAIASERFGLEGRELQLLGNTTELRRRELEALDPANREIQERINILIDEQEAIADANTIASERAGLERQELELLGETAKIRDLERAALDKTNRALYDRINGLRDQQSAEEAASKIAGQLQSAIADALPKFLSADQIAQNAYAEIAGSLGEAGVNVSLSDILGASKADIFAFATAFVGVASNSDAAKVAVVQAASALAGLKDSASAAATATANAIASERFGLEGRELQLLGNTAELRRRELEALDPANRKIQERINILIDEQAAAASAAEATKLATQAADDAARAQADLGRAIEQGIKSAIQGATGAFADVERAVEEERRRIASQADDSIGTLEQQADAARSAFEDVSRSLGGLVESLRGTASAILDGLNPEQARRSAVATLEAQLAISRAGGPINVDAVQSAASLVGRSDSSAFASSLDFRRDSLRNAALVGDLASAAQNQLTQAQARQEAELAKIQEAITEIGKGRDAQIALLDDQLETAERQYRALTGINSSVLTVASAIAALEQSLAAVASATGSGGVTNQVLRSGDSEVYRAAGGAVGVRPAGGNAGDFLIEGLQSRFTGLEAQAFAAQAVQSGDIASLYRRAVAEGIDSQSLDGLLGFEPGTSLKWALSNGLPAFAQGTNYVPSDMLAQVHEGERIIPAADNAALMRIMEGRGREEALVAEIRALRDDFARMQAAADASAVSNAKTARILDQWEIDGQPEVRA
jgi:hypothetical protein